ncbi:MAG TPA: ABC transporter permease [Symbiobacteriaceae bacterium]|nr:ABC transporter permease [Symbiobacteriaceae bacterium]
MKPENGLARKLLDAALIALTFILLVGGAEAAIHLFRVPRWILPAPSQVVVALVNNFGTEILPNLIVTLKEVGLGFTIGASLGILLAMVITQVPILEKMITPYILLLVTTPMISLVPLLMLVFGFGITTKVIVIALATGPVVMMNTVTGLQGVDPLRLDLMRSLHANTFQVFWEVRLPSALPSIFTGLMIGAVFSIITAVGAEFVGGTAGLGNRLLFNSSLLNTAVMYAIILVLALMGLSVYVIIQFISKRLITWK